AVRRRHADDVAARDAKRRRRLRRDLDPGIPRHRRDRIRRLLEPGARGAAAVVHPQRREREQRVTAGVALERRGRRLDRRRPPDGPSQWVSGRIRWASVVVSSGRLPNETTNGTFLMASAALSPPGSVNAGLTPGPSSSTSISPAAIACTSLATSA